MLKLNKNTILNKSFNVSMENLFIIGFKSIYKYYYKMIYTLLTLSIIANNNSCPTINPKADLNISEYLRATWYVQQQQPTKYQSKDSLFCVAQTLNESIKHVPFYNKEVIDVYNYGRKDSINGSYENINNFTLCARQVNTTNKGSFLNGLCILPNIFAGDYWVINAGPSNSLYEWAIVSGGQPHIKYSDGNCSTSLNRTNGSVLWLFTRSREKNSVKLHINYMRNYLVNIGITLSQLLNVQQANCDYSYAFIKS